jgi:hypothetical protein
MARMRFTWWDKIENAESTSVGIAGQFSFGYSGKQVRNCARLGRLSLCKGEGEGEG